MKIVTVRIEDNSNKIEELKKLKNKKAETEKSMLEEIDKLQEEGFMQILAYVKCAYEDYIGIVGERTYINSSSWRENNLDVSNLSRSVRICVQKNSLFIDFNYTGTLNCQNTPPRMEAEFKDDDIIITKSTRNGIHDLMSCWKGIKPKFQEKIDKAYENQKVKIKNETDKLEYLLAIAKSFRV